MSYKVTVTSSFSIIVTRSFKIGVARSFKVILQNHHLDEICKAILVENGFRTDVYIFIKQKRILPAFVIEKSVIVGSSA